MNQDPTFSHAEIALLRAAMRPRPPDWLADPGPDASQSPEDERDWLRARLLAMASDELLLEAVERASPSLAREVNLVVSGEPVKEKVLRRITLALAKYHLRMISRPTPFGLFAGVAMVRIGPQPVLRAAGTHHPHSRPDSGWLDAVLEPLRTDPDMLSRATVIANSVHVVRAGRLVLPDQYDETGARRLEISIRFTPFVREVLLAARTPIPWLDLLSRFRDRTGEENDKKVESALCNLVSARVLLTDIEPPPDCADPLGYLLTGRAGNIPLLTELREIQRELRVVDASPPPQRRARARALTTRMRAMHDVPNVIQTDLRLGVDTTLPTEVADEAERAAEVLWRLGSVAGPSWLPEYHDRFLERYGTTRLVRVNELLDPNQGLGPPAGYGSNGTAEPAARRTSSFDDPAKRQLLGELMASAVRDQRHEVILDDELIGLLAEDPPPQRRPASMELCVELLAGSWDALCANDFRLIVGENLGSALATSTIGRFAYLFPEARHDLSRLACAAAPAAGPRPAQVSFRPRVRRSANIASVPQWLALRIPLSRGPSTGPATDLRVDDLALGATAERLYLVNTANGDRIAPLSYSMLNPRSGHVPAVARFLLELGEQDTPRCQPWRWGPWDEAPFLPRVHHGRTTLSPARWLPSRDMLDEAAGSREWRRRVQTWRRQWTVPPEVQLSVGDNRIAIHLDDELHLRVFRDELRRSPHLRVQEPSRVRTGGWLRGEQGPYACEIVLQLIGAHRPSAAPVQVAHLPEQRRSDLVQLPGGEWLYAKLYASDAAQRQILRSCLGQLVGQHLLDECGVDRWFFIRYTDPDPHLRLRFHGKPEDLWATLLPRINKWAEQLRDAGLLAGFALDTYDPEAERYGGADVMGSAERVFHADSVLAIALSPLLEPDGEEADLLAALSVLGLIVHFGHIEEVRNLVASMAPVSQRRAVARGRREAFADLITPAGHPRDPHVLPEGWARRDAAVAAYLAVLRSRGYTFARLEPIAASLAHMHCNRLLGPDPDRERAVYALLHGGLALRMDRGRHGR